MTWLITSDLHLSDRPKDRYRFGLFPWLAAQQQKYNTTATFILGDITDRKDNHSATLVNKTVDELLRLKPPVYILMGNHDFTNPEDPFFGFLSCIEGIEFVTQPTLLKPLGVAMLPHQPDQASFDRACSIIPPKAAGVMLHATLDGAIAETGSRLTGLRASLVESKQPVGWWCGDIHRPQTLNCGATYVGAPYRVRFGDDFTPRVLLVKNGEEHDLHFPCLCKWSLKIRDADELLDNKNLKRGDQVKIIITLTREEVTEWATHKQRVLGVCKELGLEVFGVELEVTTSVQHDRVKLGHSRTKSPEDILAAFCKAENVANNIRQAGMELLKER